MTPEVQMRMWQQEAAFGARYVSPLLADVSASNVLEVGSGAGLLIRELAQAYPDKHFTGLEPFGEGFAMLGTLPDAAQGTKNITEHRCAYEDYNPSGTYDFMYSINVFEHLPDWRHFMTFVKAHLAPGGTTAFLCPNYSFPYEPHYRIPILFNKALTHRVFAGRIAKQDAHLGSEGLWSSLNYVKARDVKKQARKLGLEVSIDTSVSFDFLERLRNDDVFAERQAGIGKIARIVDKTGLLRGFASKRLWPVHPYMIIRLSQPR